MTTLQPTTGIQAGTVRNHHGHLMTFRVTTEQTNGTFSLIEVILRQGCEPPKHVHEREDELFFIQEGNLRFTIGDRIIDAKVGDTVFLPRTIPHAFEVLTPTARALLYLTPGYFEGFFHELSEEAAEGMLPAPPQGPPSAEAMQLIVDASARYGIQYA
ncbi:cupin domain-containing protein [Larkinella insperata]|uniref:Cupin domain-containing protein n=1 Tax=Larkinella insperata TaxID=332158 RepID=A0ABW3QCX7_9BACT|nr:cupin domain-containing protein [Larkinella insperata]